jgi:hypothetical protein
MGLQIGFIDILPFICVINTMLYHTEESDIL